LPDHHCYRPLGRSASACHTPANDLDADATQQAIGNQTIDGTDNVVFQQNANPTVFC